MSNNLTKRQIVLDIYEKTHFAQNEVRRKVQLTLDAIATSLSQGHNVELRNLGVVKVQVRKSRIGRNPKNPQVDVIVPTRVAIRFEASKELKSKLREININLLKTAHDERDRA